MQRLGRSPLLKRSVQTAFQPSLLGSSLWQGQRRSLYLHEYHAKDMLAQYGVDHQRGYVIESSDQLRDAWGKIDTEVKVLKSQILAGGRGKGTFIDGYKKGVHLTGDPELAERIAKNMIGNRLRTAQTKGGADGEGVPVDKVYVAECLDIEKEYYFAILLQGGDAPGAVLIGSAEGGMEIEQVQKENPDAIVTQNVDLTNGLSLEGAEAFAAKMGFQGGYVQKAGANIQQLYNLMMENDATQVEINPLATTPDGRVTCIDAKINFDDNASHRREAIFALADEAQGDPKEVEAERHNLSYIALDGDIACLVNGAGLAMSTMDTIKMKGGDPANFLDVGGSATAETVEAAFRIITSDPSIKGILVNIFGGIMLCDTIAKGVIAAAKTIDLKVPLVVRLAGTNQELGMQMIKDSDLVATTASDLDDAAEKIVALAARS